jgi:hypothetical protein
LESATSWIAWGKVGGVWRRLATGPGQLDAHPPREMGLTEPDRESGMVRRVSPLDRVAWAPVPAEAPAWPAWDAAWVWMEGGAVDAWDDRWQTVPLPPERQRRALLDAYRPEWRAATRLRASVKGWLPKGPEVALREVQGTAWVWVGDRVLLVRLVEVERIRTLRRQLR